MKCKKCGTYNNEDREVCRVCGTKLDNLEPEKVIEKKSNTAKYMAIGFSILVILAIFMVLPTTYTIKEPYIVEYQEPVYKAVEHSDPIYKDVFKTVTHKDPIYEDKYKTIIREEPEYETLYTYYLEGGYVIKNVYNIHTVYSGTDFWGNKEYTVTVYYYDGLTQKFTVYYEKSEIQKTDTYEAIVGYNTWDEKVLDGQEIVGYDTWTEQVQDGKEIVGYDKWTETVLDKHVTKEKTEYRDKEVDCMMCEKLWLL